MRRFDLHIGDETAVPTDRITIKSPFDGREVGEVPLVGPQQLEAAIAVAEAAAPAMAALPKHARIGILNKLAHQLIRRSEEMARTISDEAGKPIRYALAETARAAQNCMAAADACKQLDHEVVPLDIVAAGEGRFGIVRRFPVGPIAAISPFNFPLNLSVHKVAPAIAAGCPVVLKPASQTPMSGFLLREMAVEAGLPPGALTVAPSKRQVADALVTDPRFGLLTFTGSAEVGWDMKARAGKKKVVLELGGNAAVIVGPDADLETTVPKVVTGAFAFAGQVCISVQRVYVFDALFDPFVERFAAATREQAKVGDPADPEVMVGPMIDPGNRDRVLQWVQEARDAGAQVLCGGKAKGNCVEPTVITGAPREAKVIAEEAFGPLVVVERVSDWDEAIARTNDSRFGLQCGVFTNDLKALWRCFERIEVGGVVHNDTSQFRVDHMPYGGVKDSGFGREGPKYAIEEMTELRHLALNPSA